MAQVTDYTVSNQTFPNTRADINNIFAAIATNNSGTSAPSNQQAGQWWIDTTSSTWVLYIHDGTDDIQFATIDTSANTVNFIDSTFTQLTSDLATNGNDINFGDNDKANFGTGNDLQIYHDGSNSIITDLGTGDLLLGGNKVKLTDASGAITYAEGSAGSQSVSLFHTSSAKLATTSTGIDVTGTVVSDGLLFNDQNREIIFSAGNSSVNTISVKDGDGSGYSSAEIVFRGVNSDQSQDIEFWTGASPGFENISKRMDIDFNGDISFYEDTGTTPKFFWDASAENLGLGTTSPNGRIETTIVGSFSLGYLDYTADALFIQSNGTAGNNTYGGGISFSRIGGLNRVAGISSVQTDTDPDRAGLAFFVHSSAAAANDMEEAMRITNVGRVGIGTQSPAEELDISADAPSVQLSSTNASGRNYGLQSTNTGNFAFYDGTAGTNRMVIDSSGNVLVGKTSSSTAIEGTTLSSSFVSFTRNSNTVVYINRQSTDGVLVQFRQANSDEGNISVSGTTVSYNGGHLSRWSQLLDNTRDESILKGTVMSNLDDMCVWGDEDNEQLNKMKVSDTEGDDNVAGVFVNWDNDDDVYTNDMNIAMTGDMVIRIAQGVTVTKGQLLMSAGDGTAKPQGDDIVRSKTIAKVTSNNVTKTYDDGSYLVPCVLMAC